MWQSTHLLLDQRPTSANPSVRKRPSRLVPTDRNALVIGVDTGGTFTDIVVRAGRRVVVLKAMSTPGDPSQAVLAGISALFPDTRAQRITYGTTVATNAMLERRGARTALFTTEGFEDVLEIGRQARPDLYALEPEKIEPLVPARLRIGVRERTLYDGRIELRLSVAEIARLRRRVTRLGVEAIAITLLHGHVNASHERRLARALRGLGLPVTLSSQISPLPGEYERTSTTVANAYVRPAVERHLRSLQRRAGVDALHVMQSNGGAIDVDVACVEPVRTMLSGPAGGVAAAADVRRRSRLRPCHHSRHGRYVDRRRARRLRAATAYDDRSRRYSDPYSVPRNSHGRRRRRIDRVRRRRAERCTSDRRAPVPGPGPACYGRSDAADRHRCERRPRSTAARGVSRRNHAARPATRSRRACGRWRNTCAPLRSRRRPTA